MFLILSFSVLASAQLRDNVCALLYDDDQINQNKVLELVAGDELENLRSKVNGVRWTNKVSFVEVRAGCTLSGYNKPNYSSLLGTWTENHKMGTKEDNKISSVKCTCEEATGTDGTDGTVGTSGTGDTAVTSDTCAANYYGKKGSDCRSPQCDKAELTLIDSWDSSVGHMLHGFVAQVSLPAEEFDGNGWSVLLRFNIAPENFQANFQLWNADFFNVYRKDSVVEILIHQTRRTGHTDTTDPNSFVIVAERLSSSVKPDIFFWNQRESDHHCFQSSMSGRTTTFDRAITGSENVNSNENIGQLTIRRSGKMLVKH